MLIMQSLSFMYFISALWFYQSNIKMQFTRNYFISYFTSSDKLSESILDECKWLT